ncbi:MAG: beta-glucuronidase [Clostridia bacterium]|nr:beta-glucuronidase [Clostridia bacterium]
MNKYREVFSLNGMWDFRTVADDYKADEIAKGCQRMSVPASMNEIVTDKEIKEYVGKFLYERNFSIPIYEKKHYRLRIGATSHKCEVYLNGTKIGGSPSGFYPIDLPLDNLKETNRLSIIIDNRLDFQCLPVGNLVDGKQIINHDFYNFTGIHRDVLIYTLPEKYIEDISIKTVVNGDYKKVFVETKTNCETVSYTVLDRDNHIVAESKTGDLIIESPNKWSGEDPYLYTLVVETESDKYEERFGIRKVEVKGTEFLLNDKPVYFKGFGLHEDFTILGKGNNSAVNIRNFELLKWINANSFRTSHYPYSEEIMDLADEYGFMVIDEVPAVCMKWWDGGNFGKERVNDETKILHKELIKRLIDRDKNHPSVVMYSLANEPETAEDNAVPYFEDVFSYARTLTDLPLTYVNCAVVWKCQCTHLVDVICINRYHGWYEQHGVLSSVEPCLGKEIETFYERYKKPIVLSEFGADTIEGLHSLPSESFSEEFQMEILDETCRLLDKYDYCIGEHVWAFADFKTKQGLTRVRGNRKGVFTRDRQPKLSAHFLRGRWENKQ